MKAKNSFTLHLFMIVCTLFIISSCENESEDIEYESEQVLEETISIDTEESNIDFEEELSKAGSNCKPNNVSRLIQAAFINLGKQRARANWSKKARKKYGWSYRKWSKAKDKGYYIQIRGFDVLQYKIHAYGKPCR